MGPLSHQLLGLFSVLTYTCFEIASQSDGDVSLAVGDDGQQYPGPTEFQGEASPIQSECPNCDCSVNGPNPECGCECPLASPILLYTQPQFQGDSTDLGLHNIGDCVEIWEALKAFNDVSQSIKLPDGVCVRLYQHDCAWKGKGKTMDVKTDSPWASQFSLAGMTGISAVKRIECPPSAEITLYSLKDFAGNSMPMNNLRNVGDCQALENEPQDFKGNTFSIRVNRNTVTCLRLYQNNCGDNTGQNLDVTPTNNYVLTDLSLSSYSDKVSAVEIIECPKE